MRLTIEIPEQMYQNAKKDMLCGSEIIVNAIKNGTPIEQEPNTEWIPVSQELPQKFRFVNCTCHSLIDDREDWVIETVYIPQPLFSPYSDWGNIPMLNHGECEVIAWVYRDIPEPYQSEVEQCQEKK